jgi:hypothetical protein
VTLNEALAVVKAAGYRVSKPRAKAPAAPLGLNAVGKPYGANFDPNYRMKYRTPSLKRGGQSIGLGVTAERWATMVAEAQAAWNAKVAAEAAAEATELAKAA